MRAAGKHWDAALAGSNCLREVATPIFGDEIAEAMKIMTSKTLVDVRCFYHTLDLLQVVYASKHAWLPPRMIALELQLHVFPRFLRRAGCYGLPMFWSRSLVARS